MSDALIAAVTAKKAADVKAALAAGADPNTTSPQGPVLHRAIQLKSKPIVKALLDAGADPSVLDEDKRTALHHLADYLADAEIAKVMLAKGVKADAIDERGETAVHMALWNKTNDFLNTLLESGVP